jgi:L-serine dehydratase
MFGSVESIIQLSEEKQIPFWQAVLEDDMVERSATREESFATMRQMYLAMKEADQNYDQKLHSSSRLVGGDGAKMEQAVLEGRVSCGAFMGKVMARALKMGESNACMKRIVAAPTAGSCGVIPAVMISLEEECSYEEDRMIEAMYVAAGIGEVIAERASISGAQGGCQAEIGAASAMAAAAVVYLKGGTKRQIADAAALALKSLLGLVCDPVAGLVEVPCVKRNVIGAVNAITSADMIMAGIISKIPVDEVIDAMGEVGSLLPCSLRETSQAGLAATPTGISITEKLSKKGIS